MQLIHLGISFEQVAGKMETRSTPSPLSHPPHLRSTPSYSSMHNSSPSPSVDAAARRPKAKVSSDDIGRVSAQARVNNAVKRPEPPSRGTSRKVVGGVESPLGGVRTPQRVMNGERETTTPIAGSSTSNSGRRGVRATVTLNQVIEPGSHRNGTANIGRPFPISTPVSERASLLSSANTTTTPSDVPRVRAKLEYSPAISPTLSTSLARENGGFGSHVTPTMKRGISHAGRSMDAVIQESRNDVDSQESPRQGVSPRSTARVVARSKRLQQDGADIVEGEGGYFGQGAAQHAESSAMGARRHVKTDSGSDKNSLISHRSSGTGIGSHDVASVRSGSRASERDGMGYRSDDVGSLKSPGVGFVERIAEEEDIGASDPGNDKIDGLEEGEGLGDLDEEPATGQEKAKRDRRVSSDCEPVKSDAMLMFRVVQHEDLKITNEALNRMNERLEGKQDPPIDLTFPANR